MWEILHNLYGHVCKSSKHDETICFLIDTGISELLKWKLDSGRESIGKSFVLEISSFNEVQMLELFKHAGPSKVIVWLSSIDYSTVQIIKNALCSIDLFECILITHFNSISLKISLECEEDGEAFLLSLLQPVVPTLYFAPTYSFSLFPTQDQLDFRIITSYSDRYVQSLTLSSISTALDTTYSKCIYDTNAADLEAPIKTSLKKLAHNVAGSVTCELGIDVSESMFAIGKTASLVGHSVLVMLENYTEICTGKNAEGASTPLELRGMSMSKSFVPGSLILVDRLEDLFTPILHGGEQPVLHRVLNAVKMDATQSSTNDSYLDEERIDVSRPLNKEAEVAVDISLYPEWCCSRDACDLEEEDLGATMGLPMNAVSTLAVHAIPSICYHPNDGTDILTTFMTGTEEEGRTNLVDTLKQLICEEHGTLPPAKKRGIGAEILALVQSLIKAPGRDAPSSSDTSNDACLGTVVRSRSLLSIAMTVIETMQRSSAKQYSTICSWKASLDTRISRESEWLQALQQHQDPDRDNVVVETAMRSSKRPLAATVSSTENDGPVDASHILLLTIGLMGFMRFKFYDIDLILVLTEALARHILLFASDEELRYLRYLGVLTSSMEEIISEAKFEGITDETSEYTLSSMSVLLQQRFACLRELQVMYYHVLHRIVAKKVAENKNIPWEAPSSSSGVSSANSSSAAAGDFNHRNIAEQVLSGTYELQYLRDLFKPDSPGLLARLIEDCFLYHRTRHSSPLSLLLEHIQSPFQQMKNTGLELLSKGLGSLGFGLSRVVKAATDTPHPGAHKTIVIFVLGGITYKEVAQVRSMLDKYHSQEQREDNWRIVLLSNRTISSEEVISTLFRPFRQVDPVPR